MTVGEVLEQTQWDFFWVPPDVVVVDRPELLYVRCDRDTHYLNMCTRIRGKEGALRGLVVEVARAHAGNLSTFAVVSHATSPVLERILAAEGYEPVHRHDAVALSVGDYRPRPSASFEVRPVLDRESLVAANAVGEQAFGRSTPLTEEEIADQLLRLRAPSTRVARFLVVDGATGVGVSAGGITSHPELGFGFLWGGSTVPEARGRGAYSQVLAARVTWARAQGLDRVGLYARHGSSAPIVRRQGFAANGWMVQWLHPVR